MPTQHLKLRVIVFMCLGVLVITLGCSLSNGVGYPNSLEPVRRLKKQIIPVWRDAPSRQVTVISQATAAFQRQGEQNEFQEFFMAVCQRWFGGRCGWNNRLWDPDEWFWVPGWDVLLSRVNLGRIVRLFRDYVFFSGRIYQPNAFHTIDRIYQYGGGWAIP